jgi:hypothetical protein
LRNKKYLYKSQYSPFLQFGFVFLLVITSFSCKIRQKHSDGFYGSFGEPAKITTPAIAPTPGDSTTYLSENKSPTRVSSDTSISPAPAYLNHFIGDTHNPSLLTPFSRAISRLTVFQQEPKEPLKKIQVVALSIIVFSACALLFLLLFDAVRFGVGSGAQWIVAGILLLIGIATIRGIVRRYQAPKDEKPRAKKVPFTAGDRGGRAAMVLTLAAIAMCIAGIALFAYEIGGIFFLAFILLAFLAIFIAIGTLHHHKGQNIFRGKAAAIFSLVTSSFLLLILLAGMVVLSMLIVY